MRTSWYQNKWFTLLLHVAAWIVWLSLPVLLAPPDRGGDPSPVTERSQLHYYTRFIMQLFWGGIFYLNFYVLIPKLAYKKSYWLFAFLLVLVLLWMIVQSWLLFAVWVESKHFNISRNILINFLIYLFILASSTAFRLINDKIKTERNVKERENENLKTELSLLRSQVNPHFMFNILNNMVAMARKRSEDLEPSLIKLSALMRYMLYEADEDKVSLEKEIEYLQSYVDLQQQRFGKNMKLVVDFKKVDDNYKIEPMLLIPFVENAYKHGTGMIENAQIEIELRAEKNVLHFSVRNKFNNLSQEVKDTTSGIGLTNVTRRLNLLYGEEHSLLITKKDHWFTVSLQLNLH
ncbi:MAG: histidine kinase [Chitinophagaceae bacterium]|nr:histidine kinase [Chitinophagaceae bacterium]